MTDKTIQLEAEIQELEYRLSCAIVERDTWKLRYWNFYDKQPWWKELFRITKH